MKKLLAIALALVMVLSLLAGCAQQPTNTTTSPKSNDEATAPSTVESELEPVTLKWYYPGEEMEGSADVIEAFNNKLAEVLPNTTVEFTFVGSFDPYGAQWPLLLGGSEEMDIAWEGWNTPLYQDVLDGNVLPLTDLINEYAPNLAKEMSIWQDDYDCVTYQGEVYAIPSIQPNSVRQSSQLSIDESVYEYFDVEAFLAEAHANDKTTTKMFDLLEEGIQAAIDAGVLKVGDNSWCIYPATLTSLGVRGYVRLDRSAHGGTMSNYFIDPDASEPEVLYKFELPEYQEAVARLEKWREMGWFTESQAAGQAQEGANVVLNGNANPQGLWTDLVDEIGVKTDAGSDGRTKYNLLLEKPEQVYVGVSSFGYATSLVVPYTSKNPERAIMLLNVLRDEVGTVGNDLLNLLCYGFESTSEEATTYGWANYTAVEQDGQMYVDTTIRNGADAKHSMVNWVLGNTFKTMHDGSSLTTVSSKSYAMNYWTDVYPKMQRCAITGMVVDSSPVVDELEGVKLITAEYEDLINFGAGMGVLQEALDKMNESGLVEVKAELQAQVETYTS